MKKIYILDVSGYIFRSYYALPPMSNNKGEATQALYGFVRSLLKLIKDFSPEYIVAAFDGPDNKQTRLEVYKDYKSKRVSAPEDLPHQMGWAKEFCELFGIPSLEIPGVEADDAMGSVALWAKERGFEVFLCTSDKDLCQFVGDYIKVLHTHKENLIIDAAGVEELYGVKPSQIVDYLALTGDTSDNIPGVSGIGPKTASALLKEYDTLDGLYENITKIKGKKQEVLIQEEEMARLSRRLALIDTTLDIPKDEEFYHIKPPVASDLIAFYQALNFKGLLKEVEVPRGKQEESHYTLVDDENSLRTLVDVLSKKGQVAFDVETTALDPLKAELVGIGFCTTAKEAFYIPTNGNLGLCIVVDALKKIFHHSQTKFFAHNAKYDVHVLANYGIDVKNLSFDTMLASYLLYSQSRSHSLEALALHYLGFTKISILDILQTSKKEVKMREVPLIEVCNYCCLDADLTWQIKEKLAAELEERGLTKLLTNLELPLLKVLIKMERAGIYVDVNELEIMSKEMVSIIRELEVEIYKLAGQEFNINSPRQLGSILQDTLSIHVGKKTATGQISTSAEVLEELAHTHEIARKILEYRTVEKLRSTYVDAFPLLIDPRDHRIHCTFNQTVAATGRLSCQNPNLQNIPIRSPIGKEIRKAFKPKNEGWSYLGGDYSQIELRLLAHLSEDLELCRAFENDEDVHAFTASLIFEVPLGSVTKEQRSHAKTVNFGIIYGQQAWGLSKELGISVKEATRFIEAYYARFKRVFEFLEECKKRARQSGKAVTMVGREREIPDINSKNPMQRAQAERFAINTPLQGSAADLIKLAMLRVNERLDKEKLLSYMILQIHDELLFEAPDFELIALEPLVRDSMENVFKLKVPLKVDIAIGKNWKEC